MDLTLHSQLQQWLILALGQMGGGGRVALQCIARGSARKDRGHRGSYFTADDLDSPPSRPFETKWRNRFSWQRDRMVKDPDSSLSLASQLATPMSRFWIRDVASVWRADDGRWRTSSTAVTFESGNGWTKEKRRSGG
jgi:hypothetical protein